MYPTQHHPIHLKDYTPPAYLVDTVDLRFDLDEEVTLVQSRLQLRRNPDHSGEPAPLVLDGRGLILRSLRLDGRTLSEGEYLLEEESLTLPEVPAEFVLEVETRIKPQENTALEGLYSSSGNFCTQCEAEGFRRITYYPDRPDVMARFSVTIIADQANATRCCCPTATWWTQGELAGRAALRHAGRTPSPSPPISSPWWPADWCGSRTPSSPRSGREVALRIYVEERNRDKCDHAMALAEKGDGAGTRRPSAWSTTSTSTWSWRWTTSTWGRWRTRGSTSSTPSTSWPGPRPPPTPTTRPSRG